MRFFKKKWSQAAAVVLAGSVVMTAVFSAGAAVETDAFERTWMRTDQAIVDGQVNRTWMWGPIDTAFETIEPYVEASDGERLVAYFDKSRMEINDPDAPQDTWYVTNGLLATELITGNMQMGDDTFEQYEPAQVNVAGDASDPTGPTYATFNALLDAEPAAMHEAYVERLNRTGEITLDSALGALGITAVHIDEVTDHAIAEPFWLFMTSVGIVYEDGAFTIDTLFENPFFATGRPITEAYWANVQVAGTYQDVLMQCFERRCLTYTPDNPEGWQVEAGNVGQHYYTWRYGDVTPTPTPTPPPAAGCVNINTASFDELRNIIHIDDERAQAIIDLRPFSSVDDLRRVSGIGDVRLQEIKDEGVACVNGDGGNPQLPGDPATGATLFQEKACIACHSIDGSSSRAPALNGLFGSSTPLSDGTTVVADEAYIRESILDPTAKVVVGYSAMPPVGVSEAEANDLVAYIMTLE